MVTTKGDLVFVDEELTKVIVSTDPDRVTLTLKQLGWQAMMEFRRADPDLRALAEALLACCEEDAHECGA